MFAVSLLLVIQFCFKNNTKYSNVLLTSYIDLIHRIHVQHIAQAKIRKAQMLISCTNVLFNINFTLFVSYILTSCTFRIGDDAGTVDCINRYICTPLDERSMRYEHAVALSPIAICTWDIDSTTIPMSRNLYAIDVNAYFLIKIRSM